MPKALGGNSHTTPFRFLQRCIKMSVVNRSNNTGKTNHRLGDHAEHASSEPLRHLGVGIDTARYGHHISFLREDKELAAPQNTASKARSVLFMADTPV